MPKVDHIPTAAQKILILGASGQLGQAFASMFAATASYAQQALVRDCVEATARHLQACSEPIRSLDQSGYMAIDGAKYRQLEQASVPIQNKYERVNESILTLPGPRQGGPDLSTEQGLLALERFLLAHRPSVVINAVAYTAVDRAEQEPEKAYRLNAVLPERLVKILAQWQGRLIHFSTDYVFNGLAKCTEESVAEPINTYGLSKLAGEQAVMKSGLSALLIRTSWLYSGSGHNFFTIMRRLMRTEEQFQVVHDQWGVPSSVDFVVRYTWQLQQQGAQGLFHVVPDGVCTWFEFAQSIAQELKAVGEDLRVREILAQTYQQYQAQQQLQRLQSSPVRRVAWAQQPSQVVQKQQVSRSTQVQEVQQVDTQEPRLIADRPAYAVLDNTKLKRTLGLDALASWQESLHKLVQTQVQ